jgi:hypothetical protein
MPKRKKEENKNKTQTQTSTTSNSNTSTSSDNSLKNSLWKKLEDDIKDLPVNLQKLLKK